MDSMETLRKKNESSADNKWRHQEKRLSQVQTINEIHWRDLVIFIPSFFPLDLVPRGVKY